MPFPSLRLPWIFFLFFLPPIPSKNVEQQIPCLVGMCTSRHSRLLEEHGIVPSANPDYCLLLKDYLACLNDSFPTCLSQLDFHSAITAATQKWQKFQCQRFEAKKIDKLECQFWEEDEEMENENKAEDYEYGGNFEGEEEMGEEETIGQTKCGIFGQLHLRPFHSAKPELCKFVGARPLFDNRFFLVQITGTPLNSSNPKGVHVISKIAIIIRPREDCVSSQKVYLADAADSGHLPGAFQDGTTKIGESPDKKILEIVSLEEGNRVDILLGHLATKIRIRKFANKFLNILIHSPKRLLNMHSEMKNLCADGCLEGRNKNALKKHENMVGQLCDEGAVEFCAKIFWEWTNLPVEWVTICAEGWASFKLEMATQIWGDSFRSTLKDFFGKAKEETEMNNGTKMADEIKKMAVEMGGDCPTIIPGKFAYFGQQPPYLNSPSEAPLSPISTSFPPTFSPSSSIHSSPSIFLIFAFFCSFFCAFLQNIYSSAFSRMSLNFLY